MNAAGRWQLTHMGHGLPIAVDGVVSFESPGLQPGALVEPAAGLVLRFVAPPRTPELWSQLSRAQLTTLEAIARAQPWFERYREPHRWLPLTSSPEAAVMIDWLLEHGLSAGDAEVELAHFVAWSSTRESVGRPAPRTRFA